MKPNHKRSFNTRAFVALTTALTGLGLPVTGYIHHLHRMDLMAAPAHVWWMTPHSILGVFFSVFVIWHAILNGVTLSRHTKTVAQGFPYIRREAILAKICGRAGHAYCHGAHFL